MLEDKESARVPRSSPPPVTLEIMNMIKCTRLPSSSRIRRLGHNLFSQGWTELVNSDVMQSTV